MNAPRFTNSPKRRRSTHVVACWICYLTLAAAAALVAMRTQDAAAAEAPTAGKTPNIVFIFSDDHAYQAIGAYGSAINQTPNIDRLAKEGMLFRNCYVTNSICGPSRAVILTGKYSHMNGFPTNGAFERFDGAQQTFPKLLQGAGYQTALIGPWRCDRQPRSNRHRRSCRARPALRRRLPSRCSARRRRLRPRIRCRRCPSHR